MQRIFSGIQPSGVPTLGNYLGALRNWVVLQRDHECLYCVVDLHAITQFQDPATLALATREMAASLIACGIDPEAQSCSTNPPSPRMSRLGWICTCVTRLGWLNRMTQFKDKAGKDREQVSAGLFIYPSLMAADILAYKATRVPVGDDQRQHLELANDVAQKFNHDYGVEFFPAIEPLILGPAARVMSLRDGTKKMSKSDPSDQSRINLTDDADTIALKIRRAKTDPEPLPVKPGGARGPAGGAQPGRHHGRAAGQRCGRGAARAWRQGVRRVQGGAGRDRDLGARPDRRRNPAAACRPGLCGRRVCATAPRAPRRSLIRSSRKPNASSAS